MSSAITTVISSGGPMMQHFTSPQTLTEDGISVIPAQQPATMIPIPSVTLRTLVLDLLGKYFPQLLIKINWVFVFKFEFELYTNYIFNFHNINSFQF